MFNLSRDFFDHSLSMCILMSQGLDQLVDPALTTPDVPNQNPVFDKIYFCGIKNIETKRGRECPKKCWKSSTNATLTENLALRRKEANKFLAIFLLRRFLCLIWNKEGTNFNWTDTTSVSEKRIHIVNADKSNSSDSSNF